MTRRRKGGCSKTRWGWGRSNAYEFVGDGPTNGTDPSGMDEQPAKDAVPPAIEQWRKSPIKWLDIQDPLRNYSKATGMTKEVKQAIGITQWLQENGTDGEKAQVNAFLKSSPTAASLVKFPVDYESWAALPAKIPRKKPVTTQLNRLRSADGRRIRRNVGKVSVGLEPDGVQLGALVVAAAPVWMKLLDALVIDMFCGIILVPPSCS